METEVLGAPIADSEEAEDTSEHRQFALRNLHRTFNKAKQAFARWNILGKRLKEVFSKAIADETADIKEEGAEEPEIMPRPATFTNKGLVQEMGELRASKRLGTR